MGVGIEQYRCAIGTFHPLLNFDVYLHFYIILITHILRFKLSPSYFPITCTSQALSHEIVKKYDNSISIWKADSHKTFNILAQVLLFLAQLLLLLSSDVELHPGPLELSLQSVPGLQNVMKIGDLLYNVINVPGDGDCFFHCLSILNNGDISCSTKYRNDICYEVYNNFDKYISLVHLHHGENMDREKYAFCMLHYKGWATSCEIGVAADLLGKTITVWLCGENSKKEIIYTPTQFFSKNNTNDNLNILLLNQHFLVLCPSTTMDEDNASLNPPTKKFKSAQSSSFINENNIETEQHQPDSTQLQHQFNCPLFFAQRLSQCDSTNTCNSQEFNINCPDKTNVTNINNEYLNDCLYQKCRQLGIADKFEHAGVEEGKHERVLRQRKIKRKINQQNKLLQQCNLHIPKPVPLTDNEHFNEAMDKIRCFEIDQMCYNFFTCTICLETRLCTMSNYIEGICKRCKADKNNIKMFSPENNMNPGVLPETLLDLTLIEQQLIARISPCMYVYMLKHGGIASTGHCVTFPQEVNEPAKIFPRLPHEKDIIKVTRHGSKNTSKDFKVSRKKVQNALIWLKENNPAYIDITISEKRLLCLPVDGELSDILVAEINENIKLM